MLRQTEPGGHAAAGIGASLRLDPAALPARYVAPDAGADTGQRAIDLYADRVVIRRMACGARMKLQLPVSAYQGVAVRVSDAGRADQVELMLVHRDPGLTVPLFRAADAEDVVAEWQRWGTALALPLLVTQHDGTLTEAFARMGAVALGRVAPRRRRRSTLKARRPSALMRRKACAGLIGQPVHQGREIIARN